MHITHAYTRNNNRTRPEKHTRTLTVANLHNIGLYLFINKGVQVVF